MHASERQYARSATTRAAARIALGYAAWSALWILTSDKLVAAVFAGQLDEKLQTFKGLAFVVVTALLLFFVMRITLARTREEHARLLALLDHAADGIIITDEKLRMVHINPAAAAMTGYAPEDLTGQELLLIIPRRNWDETRQSVRLALDGQGDTLRGDYLACRRDGSEFPITSAMSVQHSDSLPSILFVFQDISERLATMEAVRAQLREWQARSAMTSALAASHEPGEASQLVCDFLAGQLSFPLAWVGLSVVGDAELLPAAASGRARQFVDSIVLRRDESPLGSGPAGRALREGRVVVTNDLASDPSYGPWREAAAAHGLTSKVAIPLRAGEVPFGVLNIYRDMPGAGWDDEQELLKLESLASALAIQLQRLQAEGLVRSEQLELARRQEALQQREALLQQEFRGRLAAEERQEAEEQSYHELILRLSVPIAVVQDLRIAYLNDAFCTLLGYMSSELVGKHVSLVLPESIQAQVMAYNAARMAGEHAPERYRSQLRHRDGHLIDVDRSVVAIEFNGGPATLLADLDVTEQTAREQELRASEERFREIFRSSPLPTFIIRYSDARFVEVNTSAVEFFAHPADEIIERTSLELGLWPDTRQREELLRLLAATGRVVQYRAVVQDGQGHLHQAAFSSALIELGGVTYIVGMVTPLGPAR